MAWFLLAKNIHSAPQTSRRGFVLSFSTFALALFLFIFAQLHYTHTLNLQLDAAGVHQSLTPARVLRDISLDFNALTGQTLSIDQNQTSAIIKVSGDFPNVLSLEENLLRYQSNLFRFGRDANTTIFLDLNFTMSDRNFWGRTNNGLRWRYSLDDNRMRFSPDTNYFPITVDVNIVSSVAYESYGNGFPNLTFPKPYIFNINYSDTNSDHNQSLQIPLAANDSVSYNFTYLLPDGNYSTKNLQIGAIDYAFFSTPLGVTLVGSPLIPWHYSISYEMPNDANGTRAGYDINTTIRGADFNVDTNTIWTYGG